jgi:hypothetical protein
MADLDRKDVDQQQDLQNESQTSEQGYIGTEGYHEETAAEISQPMTFKKQESGSNSKAKEGGNAIGFAAIALSILSLFVFPVLFGAAGIVLGFVARRRGATSGTWAVTIGAISLILGIFILPFF